MCSNLFRKPKVETPTVEQVAPAPQAITPTESNAINDRVANEKKKQQQRRGYMDTRRVANSPVLTDTAQSGQRSTLG